MASQICGATSRLASLGRACLPLLALYLLAPVGTQAQGMRSLASQNEIFSLDGPRVKLMLEQAMAAETGRGQKRDLQHASALYCEAASYGSLEAEYRLGRIFLNDHDIPIPGSSSALDKLQIAATLFRNAAGNGHEGAQAMMLITGEQIERLPECLTKLL